MIELPDKYIELNEFFFLSEKYHPERELRDDNVTIVSPVRNLTKDEIAYLLDTYKEYSDMPVSLTIVLPGKVLSGEQVKWVNDRLGWTANLKPEYVFTENEMKATDELSGNSTSPKRKRVTSFKKSQDGSVFLTHHSVRKTLELGLRYMHTPYCIKSRNLLCGGNLKFPDKHMARAEIVALIERYQGHNQPTDDEPIISNGRLVTKDDVLYVLARYPNVTNPESSLDAEESIVIPGDVLSWPEIALVAGMFSGQIIPLHGVRLTASFLQFASHMSDLRSVMNALHPLYLTVKDIEFVLKYGSRFPYRKIQLPSQVMDMKDVSALIDDYGTVPEQLDDNITVYSNNRFLAKDVVIYLIDTYKQSAELHDDKRIVIPEKVLSDVQVKWVVQRLGSKSNLEPGYMFTYTPFRKAMDTSVYLTQDNLKEALKFGIQHITPYCVDHMKNITCEKSLKFPDVRMEREEIFALMEKYGENRPKENSTVVSNHRTLTNDDVDFVLDLYKTYENPEKDIPFNETIYIPGEQLTINEIALVVGMFAGQLIPINGVLLTGRILESVDDESNLLDVIQSHNPLYLTREDLNHVFTCGNKLQYQGVVLPDKYMERDELFKLIDVYRPQPELLNNKVTVVSLDRNLTKDEVVYLINTYNISEYSDLPLTIILPGKILTGEQVKLVNERLGEVKCLKPGYVLTKNETLPHVETTDDDCEKKSDKLFRKAKDKSVSLKQHQVIGLLKYVESHFTAYCLTRFKAMICGNSLKFTDARMSRHEIIALIKKYRYNPPVDKKIIFSNKRFLTKEEVIFVLDKYKCLRNPDDVPAGEIISIPGDELSRQEITLASHKFSGQVIPIYGVRLTRQELEEVDVVEVPYTPFTRKYNPIYLTRKDIDFLIKRRKQLPAEPAELPPIDIEPEKIFELTNIYRNNRTLLDNESYIVFNNRPIAKDDVLYLLDAYQENSDLPSFPIAQIRRKLLAVEQAKLVVEKYLCLENHEPGYIVPYQKRKRREAFGAFRPPRKSPNRATTQVPSECP